jgi:DNA polymerase III epsilon subunit-like protein
MIAVDVESSGLDPRRDSIVSVGAVDLDDPTNQFYDECRVWDGAHISDESLAITGFTREEVGPESSRKSEAELVAAFIAWALDRPQSHTFVGQNPRFDAAFMEEACKRANIEFPFAHRTIDTHSLSWLHMTQRGITPPVENRRSGINLDFILRYAGLPPEPKPHNALTGALSHAEVFSRIAYTRKLLPEFFAYEIPWQSQQ